MSSSSSNITSDAGAVSHSGGARLHPPNREPHNGAVPEPSTLIVYSLAVLALLIVPGPAVVYIVTRSIDQGRRAGFVSIAGIHVGTLVHILAAGVGLSALVARSAVAFTMMKLVGAIYLVLLGAIRLMRRENEQPPALTQRSLRGIFWQGVIINILNPKTALFFLAFLPQFIDPSRGSTAFQAALLGLIFIMLGLLSDGVYAFVAGEAASWLRRSRTAVRLRRWVAGTIYVGLGIAAAASASDASNS